MKECNFVFKMAEKYDIELFGPGFKMILNACAPTRSQCHPADCREKDDTGKCHKYSNQPEETTGQMIFYNLQDKPINQMCGGGNKTFQCTEACTVMALGKSNFRHLPQVTPEENGIGFYLDVQLYSIQKYSYKDAVLKKIKFPIERICRITENPQKGDINQPEQTVFIPINFKVKCDPTDPLSATPYSIQNVCKSGIVWYGKRCASMGEICDFRKPLSFQNMIHFGGYFPKRVSPSKPYKCGYDENNVPWPEVDSDELLHYQTQCYCVTEHYLNNKNTNVMVYQGAPQYEIEIPLNISNNDVTVYTCPNKDSDELQNLPSEIKRLHMINECNLNLTIKTMFNGPSPVTVYMLRSPDWDMPEDNDFFESWKMVYSGNYFKKGQMANIWKKEFPGQSTAYFGNVSAFFMFDDIKASLTQFKLPFIECERDRTRSDDQPCLCAKGYNMTILSPDMCKPVCIPIVHKEKTSPIHFWTWLIPLFLILSIIMFTAIWWKRYKNTPQGDKVRLYINVAKDSCFAGQLVCIKKVKRLCTYVNGNCLNKASDGGADNMSRSKNKILTESLLSASSNDKDTNDGDRAETRNSDNEWTSKNYMSPGNLSSNTINDHSRNDKKDLPFQGDNDTSSSHSVSDNNKNNINGSNRDILSLNNVHTKGVTKEKKGDKKKAFKSNNPSSFRKAVVNIKKEERLNAEKEIEQRETKATKKKAPNVPTPNEVTVENLLDTLNMSQYKKKLYSIGCDSLETVVLASIDDLIEDGKMKKMHAKVFVKAAKKILENISEENEIGDGNLNVVNMMKSFSGNDDGNDDGNENK
eukprot:g6185.t1